MIVREEELDVGTLPVNKIILGDAYKVLKKLPDNSIDAVVTDPPYGLEFMNQDWDRDVPPVKFWKEVLRVMKHGAHLLSFFGTRTYHRGVVNIEDAGFEIRDMIVWLHSQGFPKGQAIEKLIDKELGAYDKRKVIERIPDRWAGKGSVYCRANQEEREVALITEPATPEAKKWQGWNTALKPACEPIVLARKPISEKNIARNVLKWGVGGLNIDACRIGDSRPPTVDDPYKFKRWKEQDGCKRSPSCNPDLDTNKGRYPANVILDEEASKMLDEQSGIVKRVDLRDSCKSFKGGMFFKRDNGVVVITRRPIDLGGGASRFFYCAKAGRDERFAYCQDCNEVIPQKEWEKHKNHKLIFHTTVKPLKLIEYLVRLVTPPNGIVLDPFFGTGTTGIACLKQGFRFIGIEIDPIYCKIAEHRLKPYVKQKTLLEF